MHNIIVKQVLNFKYIYFCYISMTCYQVNDAKLSGFSFGVQPENLASITNRYTFFL